MLISSLGFLDIVEIAKVAYGVIFDSGSEWIFKNCSPLCVGNIRRSGDGIMHGGLGASPDGYTYLGMAESIPQWLQK